MASIEVPAYLLSKLYFDRDFGCQLIDVELNDGRIYRRLRIAGSRYITGRCADVDGEDCLPFSSFDISNIQRHAFAFGRLGSF